jgi:hypothetical protein
VTRPPISISRAPVRDFIKLLLAHHTIIDPTCDAFEDLLVGEQGKIVPGLAAMVARPTAALYAAVGVQPYGAAVR